MTTLKMNELNQVNGGMMAASSDAALAEAENPSPIEDTRPPFADDPNQYPFIPPHPPGTPRKRPDGDGTDSDDRRGGHGF